MQNISREIPLVVPMTINGEARDKLVMRMPMLRDRRLAEAQHPIMMRADSDGNMIPVDGAGILSERKITLIANLCDIPRDQFYAQISDPDFTAAEKALEDFQKASPASAE